jgi:hypothetical protein
MPLFAYFTSAGAALTAFLFWSNAVMDHQKGYLPARRK